MQKREDSIYILLGFLAIALIAFFIRVYGAIHINFTASEAAYALGLHEVNSVTPSLPQNIINIFAKGLPEFSALAFRFFNIIAGSILVFLPFFLRTKMGNPAAIMFAFFLAIDPFQIANSILFSGNTLVLLAAGTLVVSWINERYEFMPVLMILMAIMGRGLANFILISCLFLLLTSGYAPFFDGFKLGFSKLRSKFKNNWVPLFWILSIVLIFLATSTDLSIMIADFANFLQGLSTGYQQDNSPILYPVALLVYTPLGILLAISSLFHEDVPQQIYNKPLLIWGAVAFVTISAFPGHRIIDLVWVSTPLWFVGSLSILRLLGQSNQDFKKNLTFYIILTVSLGNLYLELLSFTYRTRFGLPVVENLISILTIIIFIIALIIYWAYLRNFGTAIKGLAGVVIAVLLLFQISNASHVSGSSRDPQREILWDGYYPDKLLVDHVLKTSITNQFGTQADVDIWVEKEISPQVYWDYGFNNLTFQISSENPNNEYLAILNADEEPVDLPATYLGQKFVAESYPLWVRTPLSSLLQTDFWSWLFMRDSQLYQEYNYLWLRADHIP